MTTDQQVIRLQYISSLVNLNENIVMIPLASSGSGGNHMIVIDATVTSVQKVLMYREKEVSNYQQSTMDFNYTYLLQA